VIVGPDSISPPQVSVIIPLHRDGERFRGCLDLCRNMQVDAVFEVICVSDHDVASLPNDVLLARTGSTADTSPAVKRDVGERLARGSYLAFIDDDAYPRTDWLDVAMSALSDPAVAAVGGPGVTPDASPWRERLGGAVYESPLGSGPLRFRFVSLEPARDCDDLPAYCLVVRREAIKAVGGWRSTFYGGEDTKLCLNLIAAGFRLRYIPELVVYHHRRPIFAPHLRQVSNVGLHRGFFVRRYPRTSRRPLYFLPVMAVFGVLALTAVWITFAVRSPLLISTLTIGGWLVISATALRAAGMSALAFPAVLFCHHLWYGVSFLRGLATRELRT
jgi:glycosyltransferase involved in cell wall biosynthesis